jgi:hypothetical protein
MGIGLLALAFLAYQAGQKLLISALENRRPPKPVGILLGALAGFASTNLLSLKYEPSMSQYLYFWTAYH